MGEIKNSEFLENSETLENIFPRFSTPSFPFCTIPKTENSEMKTSEFDQIPQSLIRMPQKNSEFSVLGMVQNGKFRVEKPWKTYSPRLPSFSRTPSFRPHQSSCHVLDSFNGQLIRFLTSEACIRTIDLPLVGIYLLTKGILCCLVSE